MFSFWPSLGLLLFFLAIFLQCRAVGGRVTLPLGSFLTFFGYGCIGASLLSLLLQQIPLLQFAAVQNSRLDLIMPAAWLTGPPIEELAKALPVIALAFFAGISRRLSIADLTLAGLASGAGFGFVEGNLNALVTGTLPHFQSLAGFNFDAVQRIASDYTVNFAGHCVYPALFGLSAGIGLRLYPVRRDCAWIPAALVFVLASFDHAMFNWKIAHPGMGIGGNFLDAPRAVEILYWSTFHGRLETWLLPLGLIAAQTVEAWLCAKATGKRRDLLLPQEFGPWVVNEWLVVLSRLPLGRAAVGRTLAYFRRRRAFALATLEAKRAPNDRALAQHTRFLEQRLERERPFLLDPPRGTWLLPRTVLSQSLIRRAWRLRWILIFDIVFVLLFMLGADQLPQSWRQFLFDKVFTAIIIACGLGFAGWQSFLFFRRRQPDPVATESAAYAGYHGRALLLSVSLLSGLCPALSLLFGWKALVPGAVYISGYLPGWIAQGGNPHTLMGLGALGGAVHSDAAPTGEALRDEIAAAGERIHRLEIQFTEKISSALSFAAREQFAVRAAPGSRDGMLRTMADAVRHDGGNGVPFGLGGGVLGGREKESDGAPLDRTLDEFFDFMVRLDAERDTQQRRKLALDECERQAAETRGDDLSQALEAVKDEFEALEAELRAAAARELEHIATFERGYGKAWAQIVRDLDSYDTSRRSLKTPLRELWQPEKDIAWALSLATTTGDAALPLLKFLLPDLERFASQAEGESAAILHAAISRIRVSSKLEAADDVGPAVGLGGVIDDGAKDLKSAVGSVEDFAPADINLLVEGVEQSVPAFEPSAAPALADEPIFVDVPAGSSGTSVEIDPAPIHEESIQDRDAGGEVSREECDSSLDQVEGASTDLDTAKEDEGPHPTPEHLESVAPSLETPESAEGHFDPAAPTPILEAEGSSEFEQESEAPTAADETWQAATALQEPSHFPNLLGEPDIPSKLYKANETQKLSDASADDATAVHAEHAAADNDGTQISVELPESARAELDAPTLALEPENVGDETATETAVGRDDASSDAFELTVPDRSPAVFESHPPMRQEAAAHSDGTSESQFGMWRKVSDYVRTQLQKVDDLPAFETQRQPAGSFSPSTPARNPEPPNLEDTANPPASIQEAHPQTTEAKVEHEHSELDRLLDSIKRDSGYGGAITRSEAAVSPVDNGSSQNAQARSEQDHEEVARLLDVIKRDSGYLGKARDFEVSNNLRARLQKSVDLPRPESDPAGLAPEISSEAPIQQRAPEELMDGLEPQKLESAALTEVEEPGDTPTGSAQSSPAPLEDDVAAKAQSGLDLDTPQEIDALPSDERDFADDVDEVDAAGALANVGSDEVEAEQIYEALSESEPARNEQTSETREEPHDPIGGKLNEVDSIKQAEALSLSTPLESPSALESLEAEQPPQEADIDPATTTPDFVSVNPEAATPPEPQRASETQTEVAFTEETPTEPLAAFSPAPSDADAPLGPTLETIDFPTPRDVEDVVPIAPDAPELRQGGDADQEPPTLEIETTGESPAPSGDAEACASPPDQAPEPQSPSLQTPLNSAIPDDSRESGESQKPARNPERTSLRQIVHGGLDSHEGRYGIWRKVGGLLRKDAEDDPSKTTRDLRKSNIEVATKTIESVQPSVPGEASKTPTPMDESDSSPITIDAKDVATTTPYEPVQTPEPPSGAQLEDLAAVEAPSPPPEDVLELRAPTPEVAARSDLELASETPVSAPAKDEESLPSPATLLPTPAADPKIQEPEPQKTRATEEKAATRPPPPPSLEEFLRAQGQTSDDHPAATAPRRQQTRGGDPKAPAPDHSLPNLEEYLRTQVKKSAERTPAAKPPRQARAGGPRASTKQSAEQKAPTREPAPTNVEEQPRAETQVPGKRPPLPAKRLRPSRGTGRTSEKPVAEQEAAAPNLASPNAWRTRPTKFFKPGQAAKPNIDEAPTPQKPAAEARADSPGAGLANALSDYYGSLGKSQPPMHTTDRASLLKIIDNGKLETPRKGPAPWSFSGMLRKNDVVIRLKPGADKFVEFVPSNETFGQVPRFYPRTVGVGAYKTFIPAEHLEVFDAAAREWLPLKR